MTETVLVTGATGNTGGALVELLVQRGVGVRVLLRRGADAARFQGATLALADLDDERAVAAVACAALTEPGHEGWTYTITGPEAVTHAQIALASGAAVGKDVAFVDVPTEAFAGALKGVLPEWQLSGLLEDYAHYARGEASAVLPTVKEVTGREPRDAATFARDNAAAFGGRSAD
jgi:uncharacterized protein YbjT (DUF2867 family)